MNQTVRTPDVDIEDPVSLLGYLREKDLIGAKETATFHKLKGGVSNRVVLVQLGDRAPFVLKQALGKLRVEVDWFCSPDRIHREALGLECLTSLAPPGTIPELIFEDFDHRLLAMKAVPQPHQTWKSLLLAAAPEPQHVRQFGNLLGTIHRESAKRRDELLGNFEDRSIFDALRLEPYYRYTAAQVPQSARFLFDLIEETLAQSLTLVHGDYSPKNILVSKDRLVLIDHEVVHFGDPAFDIGFSMAHLLSKAHHRGRERRLFADAALLYWEAYLDSLERQSWQADAETRAVRHTLACCLARVSGRSPLEYLSAEERSVQQRITLTLLDHPPKRIAQVVEQFVSALPCLPSNN
jgi:5-methylthioribose kinase